MQKVYIATRRLIIQIADKRTEEYVVEHSGSEVSFEDFMANLPRNIFERVL